MKKLLLLCIAVCLTLTVAIVPSTAITSTDNFEMPGIVESSLNYSSADAYLNISSSGMATAGGLILGYTGITTRTTIHLYLQRYSDGTWNIVDDWIRSEYTATLTFSRQKQVVKGYRYRVKASCYAYSNSNCESVVAYSTTVSY